MAIDQTNKALNMGLETVEAADKFMEAIEALRNLESERSGSGLILTDFDADFADNNSNLQHVDGTALNAILFTSIPAIWAFIEAGNHDDNLQKARP